MELEELRVVTSKGDLEWEETARWIQYEEDVVKETGKWGSPHIAALEYKHIIMVKKLLQQGTSEHIYIYDQSGIPCCFIVDFRELHS